MRRVVVAIMGSIGLAAGALSAVEKTWTGSAGDGKFSSANNWSPASALASGDSLRFANSSAVSVALLPCAWTISIFRSRMMFFSARMYASGCLFRPGSTNTRPPVCSTIARAFSSGSLRQARSQRTRAGSMRER